MKKRIGLIANDIHFGLAYQRGHLFMQFLRDEFEFVNISFPDIGRADIHYLDLLVMFHPYTPDNAAFIRRCNSNYGIPIVVDIDDLLDKLPSDHPEFVYFQKTQALECVMCADHFTTSTDYLAKTWGHLNKNITVIENAVDLNRYSTFKDSPKPHKSGFVVGWTGGQSHRPDLYSTGFLEGLMEAMEVCDDMRAYFHVLCPQPLLDKFGARVIFNPKPVDYLDWPSMCYTLPFDVCAVPLYDHPFNDAKSDLRLLDMAPFSIPVLASPRDQFRRHLEKEILFLVRDDNPHDWSESLQNLYHSRQLVEEVGRNAKTYVERERRADLAAEKWRYLFRSLLSQRK